MENIKQIKVNEELHDIEDTQARQNILDLTQKTNQLKEDLANKLPKSPTSWGPWTTDEQSVARERMGFPDAFELLVSQTLTETVANISFDLGKTVNEIYMMCESPKIIAISPCKWVDENNQQIGYWLSHVLSSSTARFVMSHFYKIDNVKFVCDTRYGSNEVSANNINTTYHDLNNGFRKLAGKYENGFAAGTKFTIWGR